MSTSAGPDERREAILEASFRQFTRYGFGRTSMEDIAGEAGISRPTLYLHFRNKEEIFRSLSERLHRRAMGEAEAALDAAGPLAVRVRRALAAKTVRMLEVVDASPHGAELLDENSRLCGDLAAGSEERFQRRLAGAFREAARSGEIDLRGAGLSASGAAELLRLSAHGLKRPGCDGRTFRRRLGRLVRVFFAGLG